MSDADDDAFSAYAERLAGLGSEEMRPLASWQRDVVLFRRLTDGVVWEGLLGAVANLWSEREDLITALRRIGLQAHSDRIQQAIARAGAQGCISNGRLDGSSVQASPEIDALFEGAEQAL